MTDTQEFHARTPEQVYYAIMDKLGVKIDFILQCYLQHLKRGDA